MLKSISIPDASGSNSNKNSKAEYGARNFCNDIISLLLVLRSGSYVYSNSRKQNIYFISIWVMFTNMYLGSSQTPIK